MIASRSVWAARPFVHLPALWEADYPSVSRWLRALPLEGVEQLEERGRFPSDAPAELLRWCTLADDCTPLGPYPTEGWSTQTEWRRGIPKRKWAQVRAFASALLPQLPSGGHRIVDWCGGKGHLGRTLSLTTRLPAVVVEKRAALCESGATRADALGAPCRFAVADALAAETGAHVDHETVGVGLHACGQLSDALFAAAARADSPLVAAAVCCFHNIDADRYAAQSAVGLSSGLVLSQPELRLATTDEVVARPSRRARRRRQSAFRLGLDGLLRQAAGQDVAVPLGPVAPALFSLDFERFCHEVASARGLRLPPGFDASAAEAAGRERSRLARALGLARGIWRRSLELWLVLDRAQALAERGRNAAVGTFCEREVSPRNLMIVSTRV